MTKSENYQILLEGARTAEERSLQLRIARNAATGEITNVDDSLFGFEFEDGSFLQIPEAFKVHA